MRYAAPAKRRTVNADTEAASSAATPVAAAASQTTSPDSMPSIEAFRSQLWSGILAQFVIADRRTSELVGHVISYNADFHAGFVYMGMVSSSEASGRGAVLDAAPATGPRSVQSSDLLWTYAPNPSPGGCPPRTCRATRRRLQSLRVFKQVGLPSAGPFGFPPERAPVAVQKADIAFKMMMQIRNKMVQAYQEVQNIRV